VLDEERTMKTPAPALWSLALLLTALVAAVPTPAAAYSYVKIADTGNNFTFPDNRLPAITTAGTVVFRGIRNGVEGVYSGAGGSAITGVATVNGTFSAFGLPAIAPDGTIAFPAFLVAGGEGVFRGSGGSTTIADGAGTLATFGGLVAIGPGGVVAFQAERDDGSQGVFQGTGGGAPTTIADTATEALSAFGLPALGGGRVVFHALQTAGGEGIFTAQAGAPAVPVAQTGDTYGGFGSLPAINAGGTVAFRAALAGGGSAILTVAPGGSPVTVASTADGVYTSFGNVAINGAGVVAFLATTTAGSTGVFTGPDPAIHKVVALGDTVGTSTVTALELGRDALNDAGQIAFYAELASGTRGIYRAMPSNLRVTALTLNPAVGGPGATISAVATVRNLGPGATPATLARFYYSSDNVLDAADVEIGSRSVPALAAGTEDATPASVVLPASATFGTGFVIALADAGNDVAESSETDNTRSTQVRIGPDLRVSNLTAPASAGGGGTIAVGVTTENQGGSESPASVTRLFLSLDNVLDAGDSVLGERAVPLLAGLAADPATVNVTLPTTLTDGTYFIIAQADAGATVTETVETNNTRVRSFVVGTDLLISAVTAPAAASPGQSITVGDTTRNNAGGGAPATVTRFFLSTDNVLDAADVALGDRAVPALAGNTNDTGAISVTIPSGTAAGNYFVIARADAGGVVAESNEGNNTGVRAVGIGADLVVTNFTGPATAAVGATVSLTDGTRNTSGGTAGASTTAFYLSADATLDAGDTPLGSRAVPELAAAATDTATTSVTLPAGTAGNYFLIARADSAGVVAEQNETNNTIARAVAIGSDLVVATLTAATSTGGVTVTDTVRNAGGGPAGEFQVFYYFSTDAALDSGDPLIGSRRISGLAAGATSGDTIALALPPGSPGSGFVIARADGEGTVPEISETNNTLAAAFAAGADLRVTKLSATPTKNVVAGTVLTVTDTVQNAGVSGSGATTVRFYWSTDAVVDASDTPLGSRTVPALNARATNQAASSMTVPAGTVAGRYYILAVVDPDGTLPETVETNNLTTLRLTVR
jgi:subtilase family serine protease